MSERKVFAFISGGTGDWLSVTAVSDDGYGLAGHISSSVGWAKHDIQTPAKHEVYRRHFGDQPYVVEWVDDPDNHAGLDEAERQAKVRDGVPL